MIDKTFLEKLESMARQAVRPATIQDEHRRFIYDDNEGCYKLIERVVRQQGEVANVECLVDLVLEEARRRENVTGEWMTVTFQKNGALFSADDRERLDVYTFTRELSPEWRTIRGVLGKPMKHVEFLRLLQSLRGVLVNAGTVIRAFRAVDVSRVARFASSPTLQEGKASVGLAIDLLVKMTGGGETTARLELPENIAFVLPFARGGDRKWELNAEVFIEVVREGEKETLNFGFLVPDIEAVERDARELEVEQFRVATQTLPRLLVLENF